jgi:hypothetical protein
MTLLLGNRTGNAPPGSTFWNALSGSTVRSALLGTTFADRLAQALSQADSRAVDSIKTLVESAYGIALEAEIR